MNKLLSILILAALPWAASRAELEHYPTTSHYEQSVHSVTQDGRVRVVITKHKPRLHLAKTQRPVVLLALNDDDTDYYDELPEFQVGYRRPELIDQTADIHGDISDEIKIRLLLARKRALDAYHQNWS